MKESGMDKLIELLTEHCRKHYGFKDNDDIEIDTDSVCFHLYHKGKRCFPIRIETVICKDFGFIKRLVDNDKIDFSWEGDLSIELVNLFERKVDNADGVIALLSIQDSPIDFLCGIIKN